MKSTTIVLASLALAAAAPTATVNNKRSTSDCAVSGMTTVGSYLVYDDMWGASEGTGSQCVTISGVTDDSVSWSSSWTWADNDESVKSFSNAVIIADAVQLSDISSMDSVWNWTYTGTDMIADVAYDMYTSPTGSTDDEEYEIMVWLGTWGGASPLSYTYTSEGLADPIGSVTVGGNDFNLFKGSNGDTIAYSFVSNSGNITSFSGDVKEFYTYLIDNEDFSDSQYLVSVGAGTEAFIGTDAEFTVSAYSIDIATGSDGTTTEDSTSDDSTTTAASSSAATTTTASPTTTADVSVVTVVATATHTAWEWHG